MKYIIDRSKWVCGQRAYMGETLMLNEQGRMCCLGQVCKQSGVSLKELAGRGGPYHIKLHKPRAKVPHWLLSYSRNSNLAECLMNVNDNGAISHQTRERRITKLMKEAGHDVVFVGKFTGGKK